MKKAIVAIILFSAAAANAGILRFSVKHIAKPAIHGAKKAAHKSAHGLRRASHIAKKVIV